METHVRVLLIAGLGCLLLTGASAPTATPEELRLVVGQNRPLSAPGPVARVAVGDPAVADVRVLGATELLVLGVGEGRTTLHVWSSGKRLEYTLNVRRRSPEGLATQLGALLEGVAGVQARVVGDEVYLEGETLTVEDEARVTAIRSSFPEVRSLVAPSPKRLATQAESLARLLTEHGITAVSVRVVGQRLWMEGRAPTLQAAQQAERMAQSLGLSVDNLIRPAPPPVVRVEVELVELRGGDDRSIGVSWPGRVATDRLAASADMMGGALTWEAGAAASATAAIQARMNTGTAHLLSKPRLFCTSGQKARLTVGGEVPVPAVGANVATVDWKEYGVILEVTPTVGEDGRIDTEVAAELSDVDVSLTVRSGGSTLPGFRKRAVQTRVSVAPGEPVVLTGLVHHERQKSVDKVPLLGQIPLIGELFKSRDVVDRRSELLVIVTPRVVTAAADAAETTTVRSIRARYEAGARAAPLQWRD